MGHVSVREQPGFLPVRSSDTSAALQRIRTSWRRSRRTRRLMPRPLERFTAFAMMSPSSPHRPQKNRPTFPRGWLGRRGGHCSIRCLAVSVSGCVSGRKAWRPRRGRPVGLTRVDWAHSPRLHAQPSAPAGYSRIRRRRADFSRPGIPGWFGGGPRGQPRAQASVLYAGPRAKRP